MTHTMRTMKVDAAATTAWQKTRRSQNLVGWWWMRPLFLVVAIVFLAQSSVAAANAAVIDNEGERSCSSENNDGSCNSSTEEEEYVPAIADVKEPPPRSRSQSRSRYVYEGGSAAMTSDSDTDADSVVCIDEQDYCYGWATEGECEDNPEYMLRTCPVSCGLCDDEEEFRISLGVQQVIDAEHAEEIMARIEDAKHYVYNEIAKDPEKQYLLEGCRLNDENCAFWAVVGECEKNQGYMKTQCTPVCETCEELAITVRCPLDLENMPNAWKPGDLNEFFTNITTLKEYKHYEPKVLSRPDYLAGDTEETADYQIGPWVVVMENVVSEEEAQRLIELGAIEGYERSKDVGEENFDGTYDEYISDARTSTNAWCQNECSNDILAQRVVARVTNITNIPEVNSENLQLLRYEVGQRYVAHHDYIEFDKERQSGVRLLTVFLYLNSVEEGGGTNFPELDITVQPKRGRALIWPSVLDEDPDEVDPRTEHQALPVIKGVKYGANAWVHQRDFKTPNSNGC